MIQILEHRVQIDGLFKQNIVNKSLSIILVVLTLISFWFVNNNWTYPSLKTIPQLAAADLIDSNKGKTFSFSGKVYKKLVRGNGLHIYRTVSSDQSLEVESTLWPAFGNYSDLNHKFPLNITGILGKYDGLWQLNPLSSQHIQSDIDLVDLSKAIKQTNKTLLIGPIKIEKYKIVRWSTGQKNLKILVHNGRDFVDALMWEKQWDENTIKTLKADELFYVEAEVREYRGDVSLTIENIHILSTDTFQNKIRSLKSLSVNLLDAINRMDDTIIVGPVKPLSSNLTRSGEHLQFKVTSNGSIVGGIMFANKWNNDDRAMFNGNESFYLKAKIGTYNQKPNLQADWIIAK